MGGGSAVTCVMPHFTVGPAYIKRLWEGVAPRCLSLGSSPMSLGVRAASFSPMRSTAEVLESQAISHQWLEIEIFFFF